MFRKKEWVSSWNSLPRALSTLKELVMLRNRYRLRRSVYVHSGQNLNFLSLPYCQTKRPSPHVKVLLNWFIHSVGCSIERLLKRQKRFVRWWIRFICLSLCQLYCPYKAASSPYLGHLWLMRVNLPDVIMVFCIQLRKQELTTLTCYLHPQKGNGAAQCSIPRNHCTL